MVSRVPTDFMKKQFTEAARYARKARNFIYFGIAVFIIGVIAGIIFRERFNALLDSFRIIAERFRGRSASATIVMIFFRNVSSVALSILLGAFWGIVPLTAAIINGVLVGIVISYGMKTGLMVVFGSLLPHGIFELPAIFLSWGLGLWLGAWPFRMDKRETFCERMEGALQVLFTFIVPLLMIAAVIEGLGIAGIH
jgi:stage II sporulation protein M